MTNEKYLFYSDFIVYGHVSENFLRFVKIAESASRQSTVAMRVWDDRTLGVVRLTTSGVVSNVSRRIIMCACGMYFF